MIFSLKSCFTDESLKSKKLENRTFWCPFCFTYSFVDDTFWLGLIQTDTGLEWITGEPVTWSLWTSSSHSEAPGCFLMVRDHSWTTDECEHIHQYICRVPRRKFIWVFVKSTGPGFYRHHIIYIITLTLRDISRKLEHDTFIVILLWLAMRFTFNDTY